MGTKTYPKRSVTTMLVASKVLAEEAGIDVMASREMHANPLTGRAVPGRDPALRKGWPKGKKRGHKAVQRTHRAVK